MKTPYRTLRSFLPLFLALGPAVTAGAQPLSLASVCFAKMDADLNQGANDLAFQVQRLCSLDCAAYSRPYCHATAPGAQNPKVEQYRRLSENLQRREAEDIEALQREESAAGAGADAVAEAKRRMAGEYQSFAKQFDTGTGLKDTFGTVDLEFRNRRDYVLKSDPRTCRQQAQFREIIGKAVDAARLQSRALEKGVDCFTDRAKELDGE